MDDPTTRAEAAQPAPDPSPATPVAPADPVAPALPPPPEAPPTGSMAAAPGIPPADPGVALGAGGAPAGDPWATPPPPAAGDPWATPPPQTASGASPRSLLIGAVLVLGIIVLTVLVGATLLKGSKGGDSYEAIAQDVGNQILAEPGFKAKYGSITSAGQAFAVGQQVARQGLGHLGDADLLRYWQASNKMLQGASDAVCGRILRSTATSDDALAAAKALDTASFRDLADVLLLAVRADLRGDAAVPPPSSQQVGTALAALQKSMGPSMLQSATTLADASASDAAVCAAGRTFLAGVMALPDPDRTVILRYMIASL